MTAAPVPAPPPGLPVGPSLVEVRYLPAVDIEAPHDDPQPYSRRGPLVLRLFGVQAGFRYARIGLRKGDRHLDMPLSAADLRELAADALAKADLLDGGGS